MHLSADQHARRQGRRGGGREGGRGYSRKKEERVDLADEAVADDAGPVARSVEQHGVAFVRKPEREEINTPRIRQFTRGKNNGRQVHGTAAQARLKRMNACFQGMPTI